MLTLTLDPNDNLFSTIEKIRLSSGLDFCLPVSGEFTWTQNPINLKVLRREVKILKKNLTLSPQDDISRELVAGLDLEMNETQPDAFGFVAGQDVAENLAAGGLNRRRPSLGLSRLVPLLKERLGGIIAKLPRLPNFGILLLFGILLGLGLLSVVGYFLVNYLPKATINLSVSSESLVKSVEVEASPSAETADVQARIIPAISLTVSAKGKAEGEATGKKEVGEPASGSVTLYNKTSENRFIKKGTILRKVTVAAGQDFAFLTSQDVNLPAREATATPQPGYVFGKVGVSVSAEKSGPDYNLSSGSNFSIGSSPTADLVGQNDQSFSGGSSRTIKIVTKDDQQKILAALSKDLDEKLKADLRGRLVGDQKLEDGALLITVTKEAFDKGVNEETDRFNLDLERTASALAYSPSVLDQLLGEVLKGLVPENYELYSGDQSTSVTGVTVVGQRLKFTAKVKGDIIPKLDVAKIKNDLAGRSIEEARQYLNKLNGVDAVNLSIFPSLSFWQKIPSFKQRIIINIERK